jgi:hypothetical protein
MVPERSERSRGFSLRTMTARPPCPVCGDSEVKEILRSSLVPELAEHDAVIAYRCSLGHVFTPPEERHKAAATQL